MAASLRPAVSSMPGRVRIHHERAAQINTNGTLSPCAPVNHHPCTAVRPARISQGYNIWKAIWRRKSDLLHIFCAEQCATPLSASCDRRDLRLAHATAVNYTWLSAGVMQDGGAPALADALRRDAASSGTRVSPRIGGCRVACPSMEGILAAGEGGLGTSGVERGGIISGERFQVYVGDFTEGGLRGVSSSIATPCSCCAP